MIVVYALGLVLALFAGAGLTLWVLPVVLGMATSKSGRHSQDGGAWLPPTAPPPAEQSPYIFDGPEPRYRRRPYVDDPTGDIYSRFAAEGPGTSVVYQDITSPDGAQ
jgi:hypothetical protein